MDHTRKTMAILGSALLGCAITAAAAGATELDHLRAMADSPAAAYTGFTGDTKVGSLAVAAPSVGTTAPASKDILAAPALPGPTGEALPAPEAGATAAGERHSSPGWRTVANYSLVGALIVAAGLLLGALILAVPISALPVAVAAGGGAVAGAVTGALEVRHRNSDPSPR